MKLTRLGCISMIAAAASLSAATIELTPATIEGWNIVGANALVSTGDASFAISSNTRVARTVRSAEVFLTLTSRPDFANKASESAILEVGSAALAFVRNGSVGEIVCFDSEGKPQTLPFQFPLNQEGASKAHSEIIVLRDAIGLTVASGNQAVRIPLKADVDGIRVGVSSGAQPWEVQRFLIEIPDTSFVSEARTRESRDLEMSDPERIERLRRALEAFGPRKPADETFQKLAPLGQRPGQGFDRGNGESGLEVFTPSAVRFTTPVPIKNADSLR